MNFISQTVTTPTIVQSLADVDVRPKDIVCGDNYSAIISLERKLLVCGQIDGGKLGLGRSISTGQMIHFKEISSLSDVKQVSCGPNHMLAIVKSKGLPSRVYAWGRNFSGQLGLNSRKDHFSPKEVKRLSEKNIIKVQCGFDFSVALEGGQSGRIWIWGNYKFACDRSLTADLLEPYDKSEGLTRQCFSNIYCHYFYCIGET